MHSSINKIYERACQLIIACPYSAELFKLIEKTFHKMSFLVDMVIAFPFVYCIGLWRYYTFSPVFSYILPNFLCSVCLAASMLLPFMLSCDNILIACVLSWICPAVSFMYSGFPSPSTTAWILVVLPPELLPMCWFTSESL